MALALTAACAPRPEPAANNQPPQEVSQSQHAVAPEAAPKGDETVAAKAAAGAADAEADIEPEPEPVADPLAPLPDEIRERFANLPRDPAPEGLIRNSHYWVSNELSQHFWHEHIAGLGGAYLGVGTDQNYLLAGWAQSDLIVVVDFDQAIIDLHQVYALFFELSETPQELIDRWDAENAEQSLALLQEHYADRPDYAQIRRAYKIARQSVSARLRRTKRLYGEEQGLPTFVSDQAQYDHIRTLSRNGRIFSVRGDFTGDQTMVALAEAMNAADMAFNVIYLSNVEQYVDYGPQMRRNLSRQPVGDKGMVVRTLGWSAFGFAEGEEYHYNVQPAPLFTQWLQRSRVKNLPAMLHYRTRVDTQGLSLLDGEVQRTGKPPEVAP